MPATPGTATAPAVLSVLRVQDLVPSILFLASFLVPFHFYSPIVWTWLEGYSAEQIFLLCPFLVPTAVFWSYSLVLAVLDLWRVPISFWRYRIQPAKSPLLGWYVKAGKQALFNWLFVNGPLGYIAYWVIVRIQQRDPASELLPTWPIILRDLLVFVLVEELGFYYSHRLFHHPLFYRRFHKRHHEFTAPIGLAAIYAHPLEHLLANLLPLFAGPLLMQSHVLLFALWLTIGIVNTINSHCGFALPFMPSPLAHDYHHQVFNANYGVLGILDALHNTQGNFEVWRDKWTPATADSDLHDE